MADSSPGKVQALRAIFSEQNRPVMGLMPPGGKIPSRPWASLDTAQETTALKEKRLNDSSSLPRNKPVIGPKPAYLLPRVTSTESVDKAGSQPQTRTTSEVLPRSTRAFGETIASFMFASNKENEQVEVRARTPPPVPPLPKPRISQLQSDIVDFCKSRNGLISSDNYICKSGSNIRRRPLPSPDKLGPPPLKPARPPFLRLPSPAPPKESAPALAPKPPLQRPSYPCPPRPATPPPLPPSSAPVIKPPATSLREEFEELYEDTLLGENKRPVSLIPEYTEEEEQAELYNDAVECSEENCKISDYYKYRMPPPVPSEYLQPNSAISTEELYQDADGVESDEVYEVMPCDDIPDDTGFPVYYNNKKEIEKLRKEEEKRIRKEQREKGKRQKELDKLRKKFGLTGEEIPIDDGLVKWDSRGGKGDLPVRKGETVLILRMEGNPSGRWLVKNEKGKIGYVELTNIEVDPLSVKSVMSIRRLSVMSAGEELYCEAKSEEEGIYEVTY